MRKRTVFYLFLIFTLVPLIELSLLIKIGSLIGFWRTVAIILITGLGGAYLARAQGFSTIDSIKRDIAEGRFPAERLLDGAIILFGAALLITPGLITDFIGLSCMFPASRQLFKTPLKKYLKNKFFGKDYSINQ
ncbi:MAG: FxsA family protein [Candidatus Cloacimonetes bacterium]|nr:FxsA family protein [Candidatus Cloacimonadota bacterium]